jgi:hypothetical protein
MDRRVILLHCHIFKNAGTTVDWILQRNFGDGFAEIHEAGERGTLLPEDVIQYLVAHPRIAALSSHHFRLPAPRDFRFQFIDICFLRDPLDRFWSMYHFYQNWQDPPEDSTARKVQGLSMPEFWRWLRDHQPFNAINPQTCLVADSGDSFIPPSSRHLDRAIARIKKVRMLGVVERFDDCMIASEYLYLRPLFPDIDFSYIAQNVRENRRASLEQRREEIYSACGRELINAIFRLNALDLKLVAAAERELDRRLAYVSDLAQRQEEFRDRCRHNCVEQTIPFRKAA